MCTFTEHTRFVSTIYFHFYVQINVTVSTLKFSVQTGQFEGKYKKHHHDMTYERSMHLKL